MNTNLIFIASVLSIGQNIVTQIGGNSAIPIPSETHKLPHFDMAPLNQRALPSFEASQKYNLKQSNILEDFLYKFVTTTTNLDSEFAQIVEENFWSLLDDE